MDERTLAERLRKKSRRALEQAVRTYTPYVSVTVWRVLDGSAAAREDVEEVVSDVFLSLWSHSQDLDPTQGVKSWLGAVARNKATDRLRRLKPLTLPLEDESGQTDGPEEAVCRREAAVNLWRAVEAMEEPDRTLFLRHYYYGEKLKNVAADLGLKVSTAKTRLARGRKALKIQFAEGGALHEPLPETTLE